MSHPPPRLATGRLVSFWVAFSGLAIAATGALVALPYSTSLISPGTPDEALRAPEPGFRLGPLSWPVDALSKAEELRVFRQRFRSACDSKEGIEASLCVSDAMARAFPNGKAVAQFVDVTFDPTEHMRAHFAGQPGHCMNRTAILVNQLLSVGMPARVVQVMSPDLVGHTLAEVWDAQEGWTLVDPTFGLTLSRQGGSASAWALISDNSSVRWKPSGQIPASDGGAAPPRAMWAGGTALYPEPWLYLRTGRRAAPWPYRARYVSLGRPRLVLGTLQKLLLACAIAAALAAVVCLALLVLRNGRRVVRLWGWFTEAS